jgi:hypothetical protein
MEICSDHPLTGMSETAKISLFKRIRRKLGEPVMGVELTDSQIEECVSEAIEEYSSFISQWSLENKMSQMLGLPKDIDFTLKFVSNNFSFEKTLARSVSEEVGTASNSLREFKLDSITLSAGIQHYYIPADREIKEVLWFTPSFVNLFGLDPFSNTNIAFTEFGASFAGYTLYHVMPVYDTLASAQAAELRNKIRGSEYSYRIIGGPNGTKRISLYPIPQGSGTTYVGALGGPGTPGTMFYQYYDTIGVGGNISFSGFTANPGFTGSTAYTQGNGLVSSPADASIYNLTYDELNDAAKTWVKKYAQADAKELLGLGIRGKFSGTLPIPDAELTLNAESLITNGKADMDKLKEELKDRLEKLNYKAILENNSLMQEYLYKTFSYIPTGIYLG